MTFFTRRKRNHVEGNLIVFNDETKFFLLFSCCGRKKDFRAARKVINWKLFEEKRTRNERNHKAELFMLHFFYNKILFCGLIS